MSVDTSRVNLFQLWKKLQEWCPSMLVLVSCLELQHWLDWADETNPAASGSTARSSNLFCRLKKKPTERKTLTMLTQNMSGVSYVADHSMRQLQLQAVTQWDSQWDSQWDLRVFFPNNAGLVPVLTEAPWKKMAQVTVVQLIPNEV